jgi:hypothetical protein
MQTFRSVILAYLHSLLYEASPRTGHTGYRHGRGGCCNVQLDCTVNDILCVHAVFALQHMARQLQISLGCAEHVHLFQQICATPFI